MLPSSYYLMFSGQISIFSSVISEWITSGCLQDVFGGDVEQIIQWFTSRYVVALHQSCRYITYVHTAPHCMCNTYLRLISNVCMYVRMYVRTHVRTYVCTYVRTYVCMYICTYAKFWSRWILIPQPSISLFSFFPALRL